MSSALHAMEQDEFSSGDPGQDISFTSSPASFSLARGRWRFYTTADVWVNRGGTAAANSTSGSTFWPSGTIWYEKITAHDVAHSANAFSALRGTGDGTLRVTKASR